MTTLVPYVRQPKIGQLVIAEVVKLGKHVAIEDRSGLSTPIFPGDRIVGVLGNRYATDQYEGYVPRRASRQCDLLSIGGVCGVVASRAAGVRAPTRLRVLGLAGDDRGRPLNQRVFGIEAEDAPRSGQVIVVFGSSMNSGKTTVAGALVRGLAGGGLRVAAAKLTGTAAGKDLRLYVGSGASLVLDFVDAGFPSTYLLDPDDLHRIPTVLLSHLWSTKPDFVVLEIADGIFQRETAMLLRSEQFRAQIDHVFFAGNDSLSAESGVRHLRQHGLPLRAISGILTKSPLIVREAEEATGVPCLTPDQIADGAAHELLRIPELMRVRSSRLAIAIAPPIDSSPVSVSPVSVSTRAVRSRKPLVRAL